MLLPQQSSSSTREEQSHWSAQERTALASQEKAWKESRGTEVEDERKQCVAFEDAARRRMQKYLEDSEHLKVGISELKEQLEMPEEVSFSIMLIAQQARNEKGEKLFETFRREENEVYIASSARWDTQWNGLVELERRCHDQMQEVKLLPSESQEITRG